MTGRLRLWQTDFLCSMARKSQWTQPWCLLSEGMGMLVASVRTTMEQLWSKHDTRRKTYPKLARPRGGRARLVVLGCEIGGRWSDEARDFVSQLAKAQGTPATATVNQTRLVPPLEHIIGLQCCQVLRPLPSGAPRRIWRGWRDPLNHSRA